MKHPKLVLFCQYLHNQTKVELIAPTNVYNLLEKEYGKYGPSRALSRGPPPTEAQRNLMEGLKRIIKLVDVDDSAGEFKKHRDMALYVKLCSQMNAFGIWYDFQFKSKFDVNADVAHLEDIPYLPTSEILHYLGKELDTLLK